jgi:hypothetical protein
MNFKKKKLYKNKLLVSSIDKHIFHVGKSFQM